MKDPAIEQWLAELEIPAASVEYVDALALDDVDQRASLRNQARIKPIDDDVAERYTDDMRKGDVFPPIIVRARGSRRVVLGGNHRYKAARAARVPLSAYVVECSDEIALRISYEDNRRHGLPPAEPERIRQAVHLVASGYKVAAAARVVGVPVGKLDRALRVDETVRRADGLGIRTYGRIPESSLSRLSFVRADPVFGDLLELTVDAALPSGDVERLVVAVNECRSEQQALELLRDERIIAQDRIAKIKAGGTPKRGSTTESARAQLIRTLVGLCQVEPHRIAASTLPDQRALLRSHLRRAMEHLAVIDTVVKP